MTVHADYSPDFKGLASGQVSAARARLDLTPAEFAAHLGGLLGWTPSAAVVEAWEKGCTLPGDVIMAAAAHSGPGALRRGGFELRDMEAGQ